MFQCQFKDFGKPILFLLASTCLVEALPGGTVIALAVAQCNLILFWASKTGSYRFPSDRQESA